MTGHPHETVVARLAAATERIGEAARVLLRSAAASEGMSSTQVQVLLRLSATADEPAQHGSVALARWLDVATPTVSDSVAALERKGLVRRRADAADPRRVRVVLTASGVQAAERLSAWDEPLRLALLEAHADNAPDPPPDPLGDALDRSLRTIAALQRAGVVSVARTCHACRYFDAAGRPDSIFWCDLLEAPLEPATLRLDCPEFQAS